MSLEKAVKQPADEIRTSASGDAQNERTFYCGDVVCVRSGSPWMVVIGAVGGYVTCVWMPNDELVREHVFPAIALRKKRQEDDRYKDWLDRLSNLRGRAEAVE